MLACFCGPGRDQLLESDEDGEIAHSIPHTATGETWEVELRGR